MLYGILGFLSNRAYINSLACNTRTFRKQSLNVQPNIISIFVKNMQNILWGKCQENTIKFLKKIFLDLQIWKIMGAAMGAHNVLHHKPIIGKIKKI